MNAMTQRYLFSKTISSRLLKETQGKTQIENKHVENSKSESKQDK